MRVLGLWTSVLTLTNPEAARNGYLGPEEINPAAKLRFDRNVTIIRGDNGSGKTILAELVSLLGHANILQAPAREEIQGQPLATLEIEFSENDRRFLEALFAFLEKPGENVFCLGDMRWALDTAFSGWFRDAFRDIDLKAQLPEPGAVAYAEFRLAQPAPAADRSKDHYPCIGDNVDLKKILADDRLLSKNVRFRAYDTNRGDLSDVIRALIAWNRPSLIGEDAEIGPWRPTPRYLLSQVEYGDGAMSRSDVGTTLTAPHFPGPVGYVNTDMYDFGSGIDIRESPKELRHHMTRTLIDRLQVVDEIGPFSSLPISANIENTPPPYPVMRRTRLRDGWTRLFTEDHPLKTDATQWRWGELHWSKDDDRSEFISSGENQAFFLLTYLENLHWTGSTLILDEPEIHLSLTAATALMTRIFEICAERDTQVIIITHLPMLYHYQFPEGSYRLSYLRRTSDKQVRILEGAAALKIASKQSHLQARAVLDDLRIVAVPGIFGFFPDWWRRRIWPLLHPSQLHRGQ